MANQGAFREALIQIIHLHQNILRQEPFVFGGGMRPVLADMFDAQGHPLLLQTKAGPGGIIQILHIHPAEGHGPHRLGTGTFGNIRPAPPTGGQFQLQGNLPGGAADHHWQHSGFR